MCAGRVALTHRRTRRRTRVDLRRGPPRRARGVRRRAPGRRATPAHDARRRVADLLADTRRGARVTAPAAHGRRPLRAPRVRPRGRPARRRRGPAARRPPTPWPTGSSPPTTSSAPTTTTRSPPSPRPGRRCRPSCAARSRSPLDRRLRAAVAAAQGSTDPADYRAVRALVREAREEGVRPSSPAAAAALAGRRRVGRSTTPPPPPTRPPSSGLSGWSASCGRWDSTCRLDAAEERVHAALRDDRRRRRGPALLVPLAPARRVGSARSTSTPDGAATLPPTRR